jgi:hypothetical protein
MVRLAKKTPLLAVLVCWASSCYSDSIAPYNGVTGNAAAGGHTWSMGNVLPDAAGLDINAVIYRYTIQKNVEDQTKVHVQNENANGTGYIFRETDDWLPGSLGGTQINKAVPVIPGIPREAWGNGSIEVEGNGSVSDATVLYNYRVNPCYDPQFDPNCPGYKAPTIEIPTVDLTTLYDATSDENVNLDNTVDMDLIGSDEEKDENTEEDEKELAEKEEKEKEKKDMRLEQALGAAGNSALFAEALAQSQMLAAVNAATNINSYYATSIPGGTYKDSVALEDKQLPNSKRGLRNGLAQQLLHNKMVDMQYNRENK